MGRGRRLGLDRPLVMGILNVTPDSFYDGGRHDGDPASRIDQMLQHGADIIDIGGESSRPGSTTITSEEEISRISTAVDHAVSAGAFVSVDTYKPEVAEWALEHGVHMINSIAGVASEVLRASIAESDASVVIMHMKGTPATMQDDPSYDDVAVEVAEFLGAQRDLALEAGIRREGIIIDPGFGFGKTVSHNIELVSRLAELSDVEAPILVGPSRKRFLGALLGLPPEDRLEATLAVCVLALVKGASIFRVHDVLEARRALDTASAML